MKNSVHLALSIACVFFGIAVGTFVLGHRNVRPTLADLTKTETVLEVIEKVYPSVPGAELGGYEPTELLVKDGEKIRLIQPGAMIIAMYNDENGPKYLQEIVQAIGTNSLVGYRPLIILEK
jgi:hypothetical protein